jgi:hypothetical protein
MKYKLFTNVAFCKSIPQHGIKKGDIATIVDHHPAHNTDEDGYSLEVFNAIGQTITVVVVSESMIEPLRDDEILHVRRFAGAVN